MGKMFRMPFWFKRIAKNMKTIQGINITLYIFLVVPICLHINTYRLVSLFEYRSHSNEKKTLYTIFLKVGNGDDMSV